MGYFGPHDYTAKAREMLAPLVIEGFDTSREYWCFKGLMIGAAIHLLELLPSWFCVEGHNDGPTFGSFVDTARAHDGVLIEGYVIGPSREDERVCLTGIYIPADLVVDQVLGELDATAPPDELDRCDLQGKAYWRAWWD